MELILIFAIKAHVRNTDAALFEFVTQKTMYGGKRIAAGDLVYIFASENEGGEGLIGRGIVTSAHALPRSAGVQRQTPLVDVVIERTGLAKRGLGRRELKTYRDWNDGRPESELNFKFYRQATNKIVGISDETAAFLSGFF